MFGGFKSLFSKPASPRSLEEKLDLLSDCGFRLEEPFDVAELLTSWDRAAFEKPGFNLTLVGLGMTEERPPWRNHCANVWHLDTECIEDHGHYVRIAQRLKDLAQGSLPIENIRDRVEIDDGIAWLEFEFEGEKIHIDCRVHDDWIDPGVFAPFVRILEKSDSSKLFLYHNLDGQDCILACNTKAQFERLKSAGVSFQPLTAQSLG
jgi:hypothetical protein